MRVSLETFNVRRRPASETRHRAGCTEKGKNEHLSSSDIIAFCKNGLTEYKVPKRIVFIKELPKTNVGKILRRELRELN